MDRRLPRRVGRTWWVAAGVALLVGIVAWQGYALAPRGLTVQQKDLSLARVVRGTFLDEVVVRATAVPMNSVVLDALEGGRVEEVLVKDGTQVQKGEVLFRLTSPQLALDLLARQSDRVQQLSNLSNLKVGLNLSQWEAAHRISQQEQKVRKAQRDYESGQRLAQQDFISANALLDAQEQLALERRLLAEYQQSAQDEAKTRRDAIAQMEHALQAIDRGLGLVENAVKALVVRAPISGRLAEFNLPVGATIKAGERIGRIDEPDAFKLTAPVDEFYLNRVSQAVPAHLQWQGKRLDLVVSRVFPQVRSARFTIELTFNGPMPSGLRPGQNFDVRLVLGQASAGLLLPHGAYINDSGGNWVYVLSPDGHTAQRRAITVGRRSNDQVEVVQGLLEGEQVVVSPVSRYQGAASLDIAP